MELPLLSDQLIDLVVVGGGAAGFMAAITAAEEGASSVVVLEATTKTLEKVRISGGGRCNVTHACWDPKDLVFNYPRGKKNLYSSFSYFSTGDVVDWFSKKGLDLIIEKDGRMFPKTNSSASVVNCLRNAAKNAGVICLQKSAVNKINFLDNKGFLIDYYGGPSLCSKKVLIATGGSTSGRKLAKILGHRIVNPVPSLFTFSIASKDLHQCSGIALKSVNIELSAAGKSFHENGSLLITHWGLSGPVILRLSAFAARELFIDKYSGFLKINWTGMPREIVSKILRDNRYSNSKNFVKNIIVGIDLPKKLWLLLLKQADVNPNIKWSNMTNQMSNRLLNNLVNTNYSISGKGPFGEEFVTAGGIDLRDVSFKTMESRVCPGLYFAGEILDVDGITGGFNFQHCWTSGWIAGKAIAMELNKN